MHYICLSIHYCIHFFTRKKNWGFELFFCRFTRILWFVQVPMIWNGLTERSLVAKKAYLVRKSKAKKNSGKWNKHRSQIKIPLCNPVNIKSPVALSAFLWIRSGPGCLEQVHNDKSGNSWARKTLEILFFRRLQILRKSLFSIWNPKNLCKNTCTESVKIFPPDQSSGFETIVPYFDTLHGCRK